MRTIKAIKLLAMTTMMIVSTTSSAQFMNSQKTSSTVNTDDWSTFYVQWNPSNIAPDKGDSKSFTGFSIGINKAFSVSKSIPFFIETGIGLQYSFKNENITNISEEDADSYFDNDLINGFTKAMNYFLNSPYMYKYDEDDLKSICDPEMKFYMFSAKVPINLVYNWQLPNSNISIAPFAGITLRYNFYGKEEFKYNWNSDFEMYWKKVYGKQGFERDYGDKESNIFDKDDMGSSDATWKRFQIGWQIGVNARFSNQFLVGVSYGSDFSEIYKKAKINTTSITLGYCF